MIDPREVKFDNDINSAGVRPEDEEDDIDDADEDEEEDEGISFEKYVELRTKVDRFGDDKALLYKLVENEGYSRDDWDFYENVWTVEMTDPEKLNRFSELYALYTEKNK